MKCLLGTTIDCCFFIADCGAPEIAIMGDVSNTSTIEGAIVTLSYPVDITCIRNGRVAQWMPDPANVQCSSQGTYATVKVKGHNSRHWVIPDTKHPLHQCSNLYTLAH